MKGASKIIGFLSAATGILWSCIIFPGCSSEQGKRWRTLQGGAWNTTYTIKYEGSADLTDSIISTINNIDAVFSPFNPNSLVAKINENKGNSVTGDFIKVFDKSLELWHVSGGYFDPTVEPLLNLWGFGAKNNGTDYSPSENDIVEAISKVGIGECRIEGDSLIKKSSETSFNFSAIAKGYGCDKIAEMFEREGVVNYMIEIGGELRLKGQSPRNRDWVVRIDMPVSDNGGVPNSGITKIAVTDCGIATSGNYRNIRQMKDGSRVWHSINPITGFPNITPLLSVTVIAPNAMDADGLATAAMSMPYEDAVAMLANINQICSMIILEGSPSNDIGLPSGWKTLFSDTDFTVICSGNFPKTLK